MVKTAWTAFALGGAIGTVIAVTIAMQPQEPLADKIVRECTAAFAPNSDKINACSIAAAAKYTVDSDQARLDRVMAKIR